MKWLGEKNGFSSDFFKIGGNNGKQDRRSCFPREKTRVREKPVLFLIFPPTPKESGKIRPFFSTPGPLRFLWNLKGPGVEKKGPGKRTLVCRRKSQAIFDGRRRIPRKFMEFSGDSGIVKNSPFFSDISPDSERSRRKSVLFLSEKGPGKKGQESGEISEKGRIFSDSDTFSSFDISPDSEGVRGKPVLFLKEKGPGIVKNSPFFPTFFYPIRDR